MPTKAAATSAVSMSARFRKRSANANGIVLVQDGQGQRHRGVVSEQLDRPRIAAGVELRQMQRRHGKGGERGNPQRAPSAGLTSRDERHRQDERHKHVRQQSQCPARPGRRPPLHSAWR